LEEALKPNGGNASWGDDGYYFVEAGEFVRFYYDIYLGSYHANNLLEMGRSFHSNVEVYG